MDKKIIFVGGIHGVGKTTLCKQLASSLCIDHYSASQLISMLKKHTSENDNKKVKNISGNQSLLISAINQYLDKDTATILDGHFCLLNTNSEISRIPKETFNDISPIAIITLHDEIANIEKKIKNRDGTDYDAKLLSSFQEEEIMYSTDIANILDIPHLIFNVSGNSNELSTFIMDLTGGHQS